MISKAYECLTDEKAMAVCKKYGNPDGPGTFNVSIALPSFLLNKVKYLIYCKEKSCDRFGNFLFNSLGCGSSFSYSMVQRSEQV
jgi:hypothetical protein